MADRVCPACGQRLPRWVPDDMRAELLRALADPIKYRPIDKPSNKSRPFDATRDVYESQSANEWYVTHGHELTYRGPFPRVVVFDLRAKGYLEPTFPGGQSAEVCFKITEAGRRAVAEGTI